jgi:hypothetical protein
MFATKLRGHLAQRNSRRYSKVLESQGASAFDFDSLDTMLRTWHCVNLKLLELVRDDPT